MTISGAHKALAYPPPPVRVRRVGERATAPAPTFRGAAQQAQTITAPAWILAGPAETGKTFAGLWRLDSLARQYPDQYILARKVRATMDSTVLGTWRRIIAIRGGVEVFGGERPAFYAYPNGARVWVVGFDNPDKILSGEFGGAYVNQAEELDEEDWETLTTRVTGRGAVTPHPMTWGDCNPGPEDHWIIRRRDAGSLALLDSRHEDNPTLYDERGVLTAQGVRTMATLDALTGVRYLRLRRGLWVGAEGQYFDMLDAARHLTDEPWSSSWDVWAALDYGFHHPLAFGVFAQSPAGIVILVGFHIRHKLYINQHCDAMDDLLDALGLARRGLRIVAGHDCWATSKDDPETVADKFGKRGYVLERATISRIIGARAIGERLAAGTLLLHRQHGGPAMLAALSRMVHDPRNPEDVLKVNADAAGRGGDDAYDMLRYGVMAAPDNTSRVARPAPQPNRWKDLR